MSDRQCNIHDDCRVNEEGICFGPCLIRNVSLHIDRGDWIRWKFLDKWIWVNEDDSFLFDFDRTDVHYVAVHYIPTARNDGSKYDQ